jgi:hypothetical protein
LYETLGNFEIDLEGRLRPEEARGIRRSDLFADFVLQDLRSSVWHRLFNPMSKSKPLAHSNGSLRGVIAQPADAN